MSSSSRASLLSSSGGDIVKQGCLKKLKTMKKKYFVLRGDSAESSACLEYYDSEKKFKTNHPPKRKITLKMCFNINKRNDTRQKWVIALYTKKDCFCLVLENEEEMEEWLKALLELQLGEAIPEGEPVRPNFEHVWQVMVLDKELGSKKGILGLYHLCLTDQNLSLVKASNSNDDRFAPVEFSLQKIRTCGHFDCFFYMEVGQCTVTGPGNLWMQTEDRNIAENMHTTILNACSNCSKKELQPKARTRSSSANEASKPMALVQRGTTTHTAGEETEAAPSSTGGTSVNHQRTYSFPLSPVPPSRRASTGARPSTSATTNTTTTTTKHHLLWLSTGYRERSDSMPSRPRTTSEGPQHLPHPPRTAQLTTRPHSMYNRGISYSPPVASSPVSPASGACSTDSAGSSLSMDGDVPDGPWEETGRIGHSLTPDEPVILEENPDDYPPWPEEEEEKLNNNVPMESSFCLPIHSNTSLNRKCSPNPSSSGFKSSSPSQGSYMDMYSPFGSSPLDTPGNYLPMSPVGGGAGVSSRSSNTINHSRGSSLTDDGYVPMNPPASDDGYVDMEPGSHKKKQGSLGSISSKTPSTDIKFCEYPLDKVSAYFSPEEEITPTERPTRAYSVGSRPNTNTTRSEVVSSNTCERVRAFSVGSRSVRMFSRVVPPSSSHSSVEPNDDMMELDFSKKARRARKKGGSSERLSVPGSCSTLSSAASSYSTAEGSYMEMSPPKNTRLFARSPPKSSPPVSAYSSPFLGRVPEAGEYVTQRPAVDGYLEMRPSDPKHIVARNKVRVESFPLARGSPPIKPALLSRGNNKEDYLDMSLKRKMSLTEDNNNSKVVVERSTPVKQADEYVEMSLGPKAEKPDTSGETDYMEMGGSSKKEPRHSSQPITIQAAKEGWVSPKGASLYLPLGSPGHSPSSTLGRRLRRESRENAPIFPFSPEPSAKCPVDATSGEVKICSSEEEERLSPVERLLTGLGATYISGEHSPSFPGGKELHYASVELVRSGSGESEESSRTLRSHNSLTESPTSSSPSPNPAPDSSAFNYAEIDFSSSQKSVH